MRVLRAPNAPRNCPRRRGWSIFGGKYDRVSHGAASILRSESKGDGNGSRERERSKGSAVISLVKAGLFCEFLISVHLPVIRLHETSRTQIYTVTCIHIHMAYIHVCTHLMTRTEEDRGRRRIERAKEREGRKEAYFHPRASPPCRRLMYKGNVRRKMGYEEATRVL